MRRSAVATAIGRPVVEGSGVATAGPEPPWPPPPDPHEAGAPPAPSVGFCILTPSGMPFSFNMFWNKVVA